MSDDRGTDHDLAEQPGSRTLTTPPADVPCEVHGNELTCTLMAAMLHCVAAIRG